MKPSLFLSSVTPTESCPPIAKKRQKSVRFLSETETDDVIHILFVCLSHFNLCLLLNVFISVFVSFFLDFLYALCFLLIKRLMLVLIQGWVNFVGVIFVGTF